MTQAKTVQRGAIILFTVIFSIIFIPWAECNSYATQTKAANFSKTYTLTGNLSNDIVAVAKAQLGKTGSNLGYTEEWCADFVTDCARLTKMSDKIVPYNYVSRGACRYLYKYMIENCGAKDVSTPQKGDLIFFDWDGTKLTSNLHHVAIVSDYSNGVMTTIGGNQGNGSTLKTRLVSSVKYAVNSKYVAKIVRPNYGNVHTVSIHYNANGGTLASDSSYYLASNGDIYKISSKSIVEANWKNGYKDKNGLYNASTFKLSKSGYTFLGWSKSKSGGTIYDQNDANVSANDLFPDITSKSGTVMLYAQWGGKEMSTGAGQTIPDGDYWIVSGLNQRYLLDIKGDNYNTADGTNLQMHLWDSNDFGEYDVFTVKYQNNGFYQIYQRTTNMSMNVDKKSNKNGANVHMWTGNTGTGALWSIEKKADGYKLRAKCSGFCLDVQGGKVENSSNVCVWEDNGTKGQRFGFIPYKPGQSIKDGVYRIGTACGMGAYVDAQGNPDEYKNGTNIHIWNGGDDKNLFRFKYCSNGYYKIYDNATGMALDVYNGNDSYFLERGVNVQLYNDKETPGQYWTLKSVGGGKYYIISKLNGYYLDLDHGTTDNRTNITAWQYGDCANQQWTLVTCNGLDIVPPGKTSYYTGEKLDTAGMTVKIKYSDGYVSDVTKNVTVSCDMSTAGTKTAIVSYERGGVKNTAQFTVILNEKGDVNDDGKADAADLVMLQKWLLGSGELTNWKNADLCEDGVIDAFDMAALRRLLLN